MIHFLHIGKTGGTALRYALKGVVDSPYGQVKCHSHATRLCDIPIGEKVIFFLRDPLKRFYSGFYSRKRKGKPRYYSEWSEDEEIAFELFDTPSDILDFACSSDISLKQKAIHALQSIDHIKDHYSYWLDSFDYLRERKNDVLYVGKLETLASDYETIKLILNIPLTNELPTSDVEAHINPSYQQPTLGLAQQAFFNSWYAFDIEVYQQFISTCESKI